MSQYIHGRIKETVCASYEEALKNLKTPIQGLSEEQVENQRSLYGHNYTMAQKTSWRTCLSRAFINPFSTVLFILALIALISYIFMPEGYGSGPASVAIIFSMLLASGLVRLIQELRSKKVAERLEELVQTTVQVCRDGQWQELPSAQLVVGDLVRLEAGDRVPADIRLGEAIALFVSQSSLTGESQIFEKTSDPLEEVPQRTGEYANILFKGSSVTGGTGQGLVVAVGKDTVYGSFSEAPEKHSQAFNSGAASIAWVLIRFMAVLVPFVFLACGVTKGSWLQAFLFAISVAVGLMPELLPMVVNACLARGSVQMSRKRTIVKNIHAMQALGSMDVLCVDKTGTLTGDRVELEYYMDILGNESTKVLDFAYLNSFFHSGVKNHLDDAILKYRSLPGREGYFAALPDRYLLLDQQPFDYEHRYAGILLQQQEENLEIIKGSVDNVLRVCSYVDYQGQILPIESAQGPNPVVEELTEDGMKVLAIAYRLTTDRTLEGQEKDFVLLGYLGFFDAPKKSAAQAIHSLQALHIDVRVLTGDNMQTALSVCSRLGIPTDKVLTGEELAQLEENDLPLRLEETRIFAQLSPKQKADIVRILQQNGHRVGYLGDGMNDLPAAFQADVGISVDTAVEAVKETADVILLKKDLNVLEEGILEGRRAFANMNKYIRITASSNFGNILAVVVASVLLPFLPMTSIQLLLLNLLYDTLCLILPWDNVDQEQLAHPIRWTGNNLGKFMLRFGPISSIFDVLTYAFLFFVLCPSMCGGSFGSLDASGQAMFIMIFHTGWFLESMWTQVLILQLLRTEKLPFVQSNPSKIVLAVMTLGVFLFTLFTVTSVGGYLGLTALPLSFYGFLVVNVVCYLLFVSGAKTAYYRKDRQWL